MIKISLVWGSLSSHTRVFLRQLISWVAWWSWTKTQTNMLSPCEFRHILPVAHLGDLFGLPQRVITNAHLHGSAAFFGVIAFVHLIIPVGWLGNPMSCAVKIPRKRVNIIPFTNGFFHVPGTSACGLAFLSALLRWSSACSTWKLQWQVRQVWGFA